MATFAVLEKTLSDAMNADPGVPRPNPTQAYWQSPPHHLARAQSSSIPEFADIAVIGSGMTGLATARYLLNANENKRVVVFEARELCSGATGRNGGHLKPNAILEYGNLVQQLGPEQANKVAAYQLLNCDHVRAVASELCPEESEIRDVASFSILTDHQMMDAIIDSITQYKANNPSVQNVAEIFDNESTMKKYGIHNGVGIIQTNAGAMWPYRLVTKIWEILLATYPDRLAIETYTSVEAISHSPSSTSLGQYLLSTTRGSVHADTIIHCTNGHVGHLVPKLRGKLWPVRGTMTVQEPPSTVQNYGADRSWAIVSKTSYNHSTDIVDTGLLYLTQNPKSGYFFLGGERASPNDLSNADDTHITSSSLKYLQDSLQHTFCNPENGGQQSSQRELISAWSGIMGFTTDGLPMVGQLSNTLTERTGNSEYIAAGYNGYGMPTCWLAGETVARLALGEQKPEYFPEAYMLTEERSHVLDNISAAHEFATLLSCRED